ncbi:flippase [Candidatus Woesearchaeota archaeon]|nr:flippase [Candidatus Woesearchaeota archaeon]
MTADKVARNATILLAADIVSKLISFFLVVAIARYLGEAGLGKYSFVFALAGVAAIFADLGLTTYITREISRNREKARQYIGNMLGIKLILALATIAIPIIAVGQVEKSQEVIFAAYIVAAATGLLNLSTVFATLFMAYEKLEYYAIANLLERIITAGIGMFLLYKGYGLTGLVTAYLISYAAVLAIAWMLAYRKTCSFTISFDLAFWKECLKNSMPFWFTTVFITIYFRIDTVLLQMLTNYEAVGIYNAAYRALDALYFIPSAVITAVFPAMSRLHATDKPLLRTLFRRAFYYLLILAIPIAVGVMLLSDRLMPLIYGSGFQGSAQALQVLIWAEAIIFISSLTGYLLNAVNRQLVFTFTTAAAAVLKIGLNLILIPRLSYMGAALSTVITELAVLAVLYYWAVKEGYSADAVKSVLKPILAAAAMAAVVTIFSWLHILILVPLAAGAYFATLFILKGIGKEEIKLLLSLKVQAFRK